jgi:hypothetical protein
MPTNSRKPPLFLALVVSKINTLTYKNRPDSNFFGRPARPAPSGRRPIRVFASAIGGLRCAKEDMATDRHRHDGVIERWG